MTTTEEKLERQIELVKKFYPNRESLWAFFSTMKSNDFILDCKKDSLINKRVQAYLGDKEYSCDEWLYIWDLFVMIKYVSTHGCASEKEKFHEFEKQFINL